MNPRVLIAIVFVAVVAAGVGVWLLLANPEPTLATPPAVESTGSATERPAPRPRPDGLTTWPTQPKATPPAIAPPRPFDPADDSASGSDEAPIAVTVVGADEKPIAGAVVGVVDPKATTLPLAPAGSRTATTNANGVAKVRFDVKFEDAHVLVMARSHMPALVRVEDRNRQRVKLEGEPLLRGRVLIANDVPKPSLALDVVNFIDRGRTWSAPIRRLLRRNGFEATIPFDTDQNGEFAVFGLTRGETAAIRIPEGYVFAGEKPRMLERSRSFDCDGVPVVINLDTVNVLTGRIVGPQPGADDFDRDPPNYEIRFELKGGGSLLSGNTMAKPNGGFRIPFGKATLTNVSLDIWEGPRRVLLKTIEETITGSRDLGDLVISEGVTVGFHLVDTGGKPVEKGRVLAAGVVSPETDADGRTSLAINSSTKAFVVGAPHFRIESVALPESRPASIEVTLKAASMLVVRVRHEDPAEKVRGLRVAVSYQPDEAAAAAEASQEFGQVRIARPSGSMGMAVGVARSTGTSGKPVNVSQSHYYSVEPGKDIEVSGFKGGDEITVRVEDAYGHDIMSETVKLGDGEVKAMEMLVKSRPATVRGTVVDDARRPIPSARIFVQSPSPMFANDGIACDAAGVFQIKDAYGPELKLYVHAPDFVPKSVGPPESLQNPTIVLEPARKLSVRVTGSTPFDPTVTFEIADGGSFTASKQGADLWVFDSIPRRGGTVRVQGQKGTTTTPVGPEDLRVEVARPE